MNPNPLSCTNRLIVPLVVAMSVSSFVGSATADCAAACNCRLISRQLQTRANSNDNGFGASDGHIMSGQGSGPMKRAALLLLSCFALVASRSATAAGPAGAPAAPTFA